MFKKSLSLGRIPSKWIIPPFYKDGDPAQACNYRLESFSSRIVHNKCLLSFILVPSYLIARLVFIQVVLHRKPFSISHMSGTSHLINECPLLSSFLTALMHLIMFHIRYFSSIFIRLLFQAFFIVCLRITIQEGIPPKSNLTLDGHVIKVVSSYYYLRVTPCSDLS